MPTAVDSIEIFEGEWVLRLDRTEVEAGKAGRCRLKAATATGSSFSAITFGGITLLLWAW